ncbi:MAG: hypothetical protein KatS3mg118_0001 [Paracoccaceae bacterium]|nr:MAG: hypothetical protein KatS3mg118_0001 [Paracoccaceae bacterium]
MGGPARRPVAGETQLARIALELGRSRERRPDYGTPPDEPILRGARAVFLSDFMAPRDAVFPALLRAAEAGARGAFVMILDPAEAAFPFDGRVIFHSMGRVVDFETRRARALAGAYRERLAERQAALQDFARRTGWQALVHRTTDSPRQALLWLYHAIGGPR